jgi:hypothetical protein
MSINLDNLLQDNKDLVNKEIIIETKTTSTSKEPKLDFDAIVTEWSYRCDKGYPDMKSKSDMIKLQEILDEMGVKAPFKKITELTPAERAANAATKKAKAATDKTTNAINLFPKTLIKKFKDAGKLDKFNTYLSLFPGGDALPKVADGITKICANKTDESTLVDLFKSEKDLKSILKIDLSTGMGARMYNIRPSGTGPGEILISWYVENAMFQGGNVSYDIDFKGQHWEVKSLISSSGGKAPEPIDPANYGKLTSKAGGALTKSLQMFFETIIEPYYENKLRDSIISLSDNKTISSKLLEILDIVESIPRTSASGKTPLATSIGEMAPSLFNNFYDGITKIHNKLPKSVKDAAKSSRISVKSNTTDAQYWIDPEDVNDITKNAGKDTEITIKVGTKINDENKDAKIWLAKLMSNQFIKDPKYFVNSLRSIRDGFSEGKKGMIYLTPGKFNITNSMDDFFTSHITRGVYRFSLKNMNRYTTLNYAQEQ